MLTRIMAAGTQTQTHAENKSKASTPSHITNLNILHTILHLHQ